ncbi:hypothetical protein [Paraglaciecola sp. 25GB23A]|uniref:hypothetical protein n=1 Tax=Paraglaciecola sp. 25GB23A TaxID=3156068 RepID=UPI0032AEADAA
MRVARLTSFLALILITLSACQSSVKFKNINFSEDKNFLDVMKSMVEKFGVTQHIVQSEYGKALWFEYENKSNSWEFDNAVNLKFGRELKSVCAGQFDNVGSLSIAFRGKYFNPRLYDITIEDLTTLLNGAPDVELITPDGKRAPEVFNTSGENLYLKDLNVYGVKLLNKAGSEVQDLNYLFMCSLDGKIKEAIAVGLVGTFDKQVVIYIGEETLTNLINEQLHNAVIYAKEVRLPRGNEIRARFADARERKTEMEAKANVDYMGYVAVKTSIWDNRNATSYKLGDQVCTYTNKMGYIDQIVDGNQKVLWAGKVRYEPQGYFFGKRPKRTYKRKEITYDKLDDVTWEPKQNIASCNFTL